MSLHLHLTRLSIAVESSLDLSRAVGVIVVISASFCLAPRRTLSVICMVTGSFVGVLSDFWSLEAYYGTLSEASFIAHTAP